MSYARTFVTSLGEADMRYLSNSLLQAAYYTRKVKSVQDACIRAACRARIFELKHWPEPVVETADEVLDRIRAAVRAGIPHIVDGVLRGPSLLDVGGDSVETAYHEVVSKESLRYLIQWGSDSESEQAVASWKEHFPDEETPAKYDFAPAPDFTRQVLNGSGLGSPYSKNPVPPKLRKAIREGIRRRIKAKTALGPFLVVINRTNTVVSLGLGEIGDRGGVQLNPENTTRTPTPVFLTDLAHRDEWLKSSDFRRAIAQGWIEVLPAGAK